MAVIEATSARRFARSTGGSRPLLGMTLLALVMLVAGFKPVALMLVEHFPPMALLDGTRMPSLLPTLSVPLPATSLDADPLEYWAVKTGAGLMVLVVYLMWMRGEPAGRTRLFARAWLSVTAAIVLGSLAQAIGVSFLTHDGAMPYVLMISGTAIVATVVGMALGLVIAVLYALIGPRRAGEADTSMADLAPDVDVEKTAVG